MSRLPLALSADHSQDNDPKEPPKREEDTLTKHNLGGFPRTRGDGLKWTPIFGPAAKVGLFEPAPTADGGADTA